MKTSRKPLIFHEARSFLQNYLLHYYNKIFLQCQRQMQNSRECRQGIFYAPVLFHSMLSLVRWQCGTVILGMGSALALPSWGGAEAAEPSEATCKEPKHAVHKDREINFGQTVGVRWGKEGLDAKVYSANESSLFSWQWLLLIKMFVHSGCWLAICWGKSLTDHGLSKWNYPCSALNFVPSFQNLRFQISSSALQLFSFHSDFFPLKKQISPSVTPPCNSPVQHFLPSAF